MVIYKAHPSLLLAVTSVTDMGVRS